GREFNAEGGALLGDQVTDFSAPLFRQFGRVAGGDDGSVGMVGEKPSSKQNRGVGALGGAGRHRDEQAVNIPARERFELLDEQPMMSSWLVPAMTRPVSEAFPYRSALQQRRRRLLSPRRGWRWLR